MIEDPWKILEWIERYRKSAILDNLNLLEQRKENLEPEAYVGLKRLIENQLENVDMEIYEDCLKVFSVIINCQEAMRKNAHSNR